MERVRRGCGTSETRWALACHTCRGLAHAGRQNSQWECYSQAEESGQREGLQESELRQVDQAWGGKTVVRQEAWRQHREGLQKVAFVSSGGEHQGVP